jgi:hypothetical protein
MTAFLYLQKFDKGIPVAMPFQPVMDILSCYGITGRGRGDIEITFPPDTIAAGCTVVGNVNLGITCVGFDRPRFDEDLRRVVWECMARLGCAVFDDALDTVCTPLDGSAALPANLVVASILGLREISSLQQLFPSECQFSLAVPPSPALRYTNANTNAPNFQFFDYADFDKNELYIELNIRPEACNTGTLRVLRNLELRVDAAITTNPEYAIFYRYAYADSSLALLESPRLADLANRTTIISPPPTFLEQPVNQSSFVAAREIFAGERGQAIKLAQYVEEKYKLSFDLSIETIDTLSRLLDKIHDMYCRERDAQPSAAAFISKNTINWAMQAGGYFGVVILQHIGAQWGYVTRGSYRQPVLRTHHGRIYNPHLMVLDHIINGSRSSIADIFQRLLTTDLSATPRSEDLVCNITGFCHILLGQSEFADGGLPLEAQIPRDKLDFSVESLRFLDSYLLQVADNAGSFSNVTLNNLILAAGAYLGEVIRDNTTQGCWQWVCYDDYVRDNPVFAQQKPRDFVFSAFLDSTAHTTYPLANIALMLEQANVTSTYEHVRQLVANEHNAEFSESGDDATNTPPSKNTATPTPVASSDDESDIAEIERQDRMVLAARGQKMVIYSIMLNFILGAVERSQVLPFWIVQSLLICVGAYALFGIVKICSGLEKTQNQKIVFMVLAFVPFINLITLVYLSVKTTNVLREDGWPVGLFGARL